MKKFRQLMLAAVIIGSVLTTATAAESLSVLLQKGIFAEETEGNLDAAIKIYQQITAEAATNRSVVAQAQYRLGVCYQKKGNKEQAISILNDLLKQFPAEAALGQKARDLLAGLGQTPSSTITIRQFPLVAEAFYSVSPDGQLIACRPKENSNIVIYETATGKTWTAAKNDRGDDDWGFWYAHISPDGRQIAYGRSALYVAKIDGSEAKLVYAGKKGSEGHKDAEIWGIAWSPDGGQLIVNSYEEGISVVCALDIKTGTMKEVKRLTASSNLEKVFLSWSGRYLAYASYWAIRGAYSPWKISVLDLESAKETTVIDMEAGDVIGWSPGDAQLLFLSKRTGTLGLWAIPVREGKPSGDPVLVKANMGANSSFRTYYGLTREGSFYYPEDRTAKDVYLATANFQTGEISSQPRRVTDRFLGEQSMPVWSKDGQKLMLTGQIGQKRFVAVSLASGQQKEFPVSDTFTYLQRYDWSHDGASLLIQAGGPGGGHGIHRYELASGATETLVKSMNAAIPGHWICHPRFSPDGNSFYYVRRNFLKGAAERTEYKDSILCRNLRSGNEEIVYESPEMLQIWCPYELSPDGERLAIVASDNRGTNAFVVALKVRGVSGGPETKELVRLAPRENLTSLAWTLDGRGLVYTKELPTKKQGAEEQTQVWATAVDSGQSVELKFSLPGIRDITIHPDGRQIAFSAESSSGLVLWVMEGLVSKLVVPTARANYGPAAAQEKAAAAGEAATQGKPEPLKGIPPRDPATEPNLVDLSDLYNGSLTQGWLPLSQAGRTSDKTLPLPLGRGKFDAVWFDVRGLIQLTGLRMKNIGGVFPEEVKGIKVGSKCKRLHILQGAGWGRYVENGTQIGAYVAHYLDGSQREIRIVRGEDIDDWSVGEGSIQELKRASIAWTGENPAGQKLRVYKTTWENPLPDVEIRTIDYVSKMTDAAPFLIAISIE